MNKAYNKIIWQNKPSTATPLNQTNLNEMSNALDTIDDRVIALDNGKVSSVTVTNTLQIGDTIATITVDGTVTNIKSAQVEVDAEPSATSENPLQNKAIYEMLNEILPEETVQGNSISISDASGLNAKACSVDLLPIQDLHGYDSPWVGGAGKNKLQVTTQSYSTSGVTIAINNGILSLSNTSTDNIQINLVTTRINVSDIGSSYKLVDDGSFTFSSNLYLNIRYYDSNGSAISNQSMNYATKSMNLVIPNNATTFMPMVVIKSGVATNGTIKPMLMLQTETNLSFAPYSNICPISGRNSVMVRRCGKNIIDVSNPTYSNKTIDANGNLTNSNYYDTWEFKGGVKYAFNLTKGSGFDTLRYALFVNGVGTRYTRTTFPFTIDATNSSIVRITLGKTDFATNVQLEIGEQSSAYEPYQGETVTVQFGQTVYGGKLDVTNGKLTLDKGYTQFTSSDVWAISGAGSAVKTIADMKTLYSSEKAGICSKLKTDNGVNGCAQFGSNQGANSFFIVGARDYYGLDTVAKIQAFTDGMQICYPLATPIEITLTAEQISLLKGNNVISTDGDNINLVYSADIGLYIAGQLNT